MGEINTVYGNRGKIIVCKNLENRKIPTVEDGNIKVTELAEMAEMTSLVRENNNKGFFFLKD